MKTNKKINKIDIDNSFQDTLDVFCEMTWPGSFWRLTSEKNRYCELYYVWHAKSDCTKKELEGLDFHPGCSWILHSVFESKNDAINTAEGILKMEDIHFPTVAVKIIDKNSIVANTIAEFYNYNLVTNDMKEENHV